MRIDPIPDFAFQQPARNERFLPQRIGRNQSSARR
jgi:hypothetical protein